MPPRCRGPAYTDGEVIDMMDAIEEILPINSDEWEEVERMHLDSYPELKRRHEAIRRKFKNLYGIKAQPGGPKCHPMVVRAKVIHEKIKLRGRRSCGSEMESSSLTETVHNHTSSKTDNPIDTPAVNQPRVYQAILPAIASTGTSRHADGQDDQLSDATGSVDPVNDSDLPTKKRTAAISFPVQHVGGTKRPTEAVPSNMDQYLQFLMIQHQLDRQARQEEETTRRDWEERKRQDEEKIRREEEKVRREEEKIRREEERDHKNIMQMILMGMLSSFQAITNDVQQIRQTIPTTDSGTDRLQRPPPEDVPPLLNLRLNDPIQQRHSQPNHTDEE